MVRSKRPCLPLVQRPKPSAIAVRTLICSALSSRGAFLVTQMLGFRLNLVRAGKFARPRCRHRGSPCHNHFGRTAIDRRTALTCLLLGAFLGSVEDSLFRWLQVVHIPRGFSQERTHMMKDCGGGGDRRWNRWNVRCLVCDSQHPGPKVAETATWLEQER